MVLVITMLLPKKKKMQKIYIEITRYKTNFDVIRIKVEDTGQT